MCLTAVLLLSVLILLPHEISSSESETNNIVVFQTGSMTFKCNSKDVPMWSWIGKSPTDLKSMAYGDKKQNRHEESVRCAALIVSGDLLSKVSCVGGLKHAYCAMRKPT